MLTYLAAAAGIARLAAGPAIPGDGVTDLRRGRAAALQLTARTEITQRAD